ncbi:MAG: hypothetical protein ABIJ56_03645 [Pseudomonadota bacterium]
MFKSGKDELLKFFREDLPVRGVDLIIEGVKLARDLSNTAARLIAEGSIPAPGFVVDMARDKVNEEEDYYKVAEPEHNWDRKIDPPPPPPPGEKKAAPEKPEKKKTAIKAAAKPAAAKKPRKKAGRAPKKKKESPKQPG